MKHLLVLFFCIALVFAAACSQNSGRKKSSNAVPVMPPTQQEFVGNAADSALPAEQPVNTEPDKDSVDASVLALYKGVSIRLTDRKTGERRDTFIPFMTPTKLEGTPLTVIVTRFFPDFVRTENGYASRSNEPNNPGAKMRITGGAHEFDGWLFTNFPNIHPYDNPDYNLVMIEAVKK